MNDEKPDVVELSEIEKSAIGEICDLITASFAKALGDRLSESVGMDSSTVNALELSEVANIVATPVLLVQLTCRQAVDGSFFMFINGDGLPKIFDLAIPDDAKEVGADDEVILEGLKEIIGGAISEAMVNISQGMGYDIDCSITDIVVLQDASDFSSIGFLYPDGNLLSVVTGLKLPDGAVDTGFLLPSDLSRQMIGILLSDQSAAEAGSPGIQNDAGESALEAPESDFGQNIGLEEDEENYSSSIEESPRVREVPQGTQPAKFGTLDAGNAASGNNNISLLLDVMLDASIELGKTQMSIEEILRLSKGSVIELDKLASEPVEFLVNGKVIARGEVVVIDDNFGIRITEILSPRARLESI
ncbi:MAG: flagellar motor switch protein FliN [Firmicutes bacterium]|nr:flagellar motor switch protein FliN [Bacillota bacterium]